MQLIGMLDSPYVRRTAISLKCLGVAFAHRPVSVFSHFAEFHSINPVVKAPSLLFDNGEVLMDSTLIIEFAEFAAGDGRSLMPQEGVARIRALRVISLALAACEKAAQIVYETSLRPQEKQHEPWLTRITGQLLAACAILEAAVVQQQFAASQIETSQAAISSAVAWQFIQSMLAEVVIAEQYPALEQLSRTAETLPVFQFFPPVGPGV